MLTLDTTSSGELTRQAVDSEVTYAFAETETIDTVREMCKDVKSIKVSVINSKVDLLVLLLVLLSTINGLYSAENIPRGRQ